MFARECRTIGTAFLVCWFENSGMAVFVHFACLVKKGDRERFLGRGGVSTRKQEPY